MPMFPCKGNVDVCPVTKDAWEARANIVNCGYDDKIEYHCLSDILGRKWEKCVEKTLISEGNCLMFTTDGYFDWNPCNISEKSCPNKAYVSNEIYKYPFCFGDNEPRNETSKDKLLQGRDGPALNLIIGIVVPIVLLVLAAAFLSLVIGKRRKRKSVIWKRIMKGMIETESLLPEKMLGEVAVRQVVGKGVIKLSAKDVKSMVVIGGIGNMMSSTARSIMERCAMEMQWKSKQFQFPEVPPTVDNKTIILVYGWFGLWNDNLICFRNEAKKVCERLTQILKDKSEVKLILAMRSDVYSNHKGDLEKYHSLFSNKFNLHDEQLSDEYSEYFKLKTKSCKVECKCHELSIAKLRHGNDELIGTPLKVEIILEYHYHELLKSYSENWDILTAMMHHFKALEEQENPIYECIMYTCLKGHFSGTESFDQVLINKMHFRIELCSFEKHREQLHKYLRLRFSDSQNVSTENDLVFWHPFIYICAFHYLYKKDKSAIMNHCNVNAILQLVRPNSWKINKTLSYIEVCADAADVKPLRARLQKLGLWDKYRDHPLINQTENDDK